MMIKIIHGGDVYSEQNARATDFSANINPLGLPQNVKKAIHTAAKDCNKYPDPLCRGLRSALSKYENVPEDNIFCSNGASEIIYRIVFAFKPRRVIVTAPAFSEYAQAARSAGSDVISYRLREENGFKIGADLAQLVDGASDIVFICNPHNPTGVLTDRKTIRQIVEQCKLVGALLVIDECFMDFVTDGEISYSAKPLLKEYDNVIVLKAFTKIFAMPGIRLGYCFSSNLNTIDKLYRCGQSWSVSAFAQAAGTAAALENRFVSETREYVDGERDFLKSGLVSRGFIVYQSKANFIFFRALGILNLHERLLKKGFLIRSCENFDGLDGTYYRIAVRTHVENAALLLAMEESN